MGKTVPDVCLRTLKNWIARLRKGKKKFFPSTFTSMCWATKRALLALSKSWLHDTEKTPAKTQKMNINEEKNSTLEPLLGVAQLRLTSFQQTMTEWLKFFGGDKKNSSSTLQLLHTNGQKRGELGLRVVQYDRREYYRVLSTSCNVELGAGSTLRANERGRSFCYHYMPAVCVASQPVRTCMRAQEFFYWCRRYSVPINIVAMRHSRRSTFL